MAIIASKPGKVSAFVYIVAGIFAVSLIVLIIGLAMDANCRNKVDSSAKSSLSTAKIERLSQFCKYSQEAERMQLDGYLKKVQRAYFKYSPNSAAFDPDVNAEGMHEHLKKRYFPYDPRPQTLKTRTDAALRLLDEINKIKYDKNKLKPRENRVISQVKHFLQTIFGVPYEGNFYAGDWMLGPNYFCWQPICNLQYGINSLGFYSKPRTIEEIKILIKKLLHHSVTVDNYISNLKMGVKAGFVRAKIDCRSGLDAFKNNHKLIASKRSASEVLNEWYSKNYLRADMVHSLLNKTVQDAWFAEKGKAINDSLVDALVTGVGKPILKLIDYLEFNHSMHCLPNDVSSGLGNLPVPFVYVNGTPGEPTTKRMPLTGAVLSGRDTYSTILKYFTTTDISAEQINKEGEKQLKSFYNQTLEIAKKIMKSRNTVDAVAKFKQYLQGDEMWHGTVKFPLNESNEAAYKKCISHETAKLYCPVRWKSIMLWADYFEKVMSIIYPKLSTLFYFNGDQNTVPNCPIEMEPHYNPSNGAQYFAKSDGACSSTTRYGMPFFLEKYGPKFQEWSLTGHEGRPGHHTQYQGTEEHFRDRCGGLPSWFDVMGYYIVFVEGWALYAENPLLSDDVDLYKENMLQKYGMYKWQTWRAVRLIVDTGLHDRGGNMTWARKMFEDYTWDTGDFARKEIVRYMSDPGQATAYMLGRLELIKMRKKAEKELGTKFSLKQFHYQVLSQGSSPIDYLKSHVDRYIECMKDKTLPMCDYLLTSVQSLKDDITSKPANRNGPAMPRMLRYV